MPFENVYIVIKFCFKNCWLNVFQQSKRSTRILLETTKLAQISKEWRITMYSFWFLVKLDGLNPGSSEQNMVMPFFMLGNQTTKLARAELVYFFPERKGKWLLQQLGRVKSSVNRRDIMLVMGDFNAQLDPHNINYESTMRRHALGRMTANGEVFVEMCLTNNLVIGETLFPHTI